MLAGNSTWQVSHCSRMALSLVRRVTQGKMSAAKGLAKGEALMALLLMMWSSSRVWASSKGPPLRMWVPVAFQSASSKLSSCQSACILSRAFSMDHSLLACSLISSMACNPTLCEPHCMLVTVLSHRMHFCKGLKKFTICNLAHASDHWRTAY